MMGALVLLQSAVPSRPQPWFCSEIWLKNWLKTLEF